jgi:hypothetical protein
VQRVAVAFRGLSVDVAPARDETPLRAFLTDQELSMDDDSASISSRATPTSPHRRRVLQKRAIQALAILLLIYLTAAYIVMPTYWKHYALRHPALADIPGVTHTRNGIPGDPLNVALIGTEVELTKTMLAGGWYPANPLTLRSCLEIAEATVLRRTYDDAPVSNLYLWDRKEDLAFEQPVGHDPRQRHHVRFWRSASVDDDGRPLWAGAATYDKSVGLSHETKQITHHIDADVDAERDHLFHDLEQTGDLSDVETLVDFHTTREGRNGGGDPWHTDGNLSVATIVLR